MKRMAIWIATGCVIAISFVACQASFRRFEQGSADIKVKGKGLKVAADRIKSSISADSLEITPQAGVKLCDVSVEIVDDTNGNGKPGDPGDKRRNLVKTTGLFKGHVVEQLFFGVNRKISRAYCVVRGRRCNEKNERVLAVFEISGDGVSPSPNAIVPSGPGVAFSTSGLRPHFIEFRELGRTANRVAVTVGDLVAVDSPLRWLYANVSKLPPRPDFIGAGVLVNGHFMRWMPGPDLAKFELPLVHGKLGKVQIVTLNSKLEIVGNWRFDDLAF